MRVFLTGATGFIGSALTPELIKAGHHVIGLSRSDSGAAALSAAGAEVQRGDLEDLESLRAGAKNADGVIHCAFIHDFSTFMKNCEIDRTAIQTLADVLAASNGPLMITSGTAIANTVPGRKATEDIKADPQGHNPRSASEVLADTLAAGGAKISTMRLPQVHNPEKQGLITYLVALAREKGVSAYIDDGQNCWPGAHVSDVARCYRLAFEKAESGAKYHAVDEEGVPLRDIAEVIGRGLNVPVKSIPAAEANEHFGWLAMFAGRDLTASGAITQQHLDWRPTGPKLLADLEAMDYAIARV